MLRTASCALLVGTLALCASPAGAQTIDAGTVPVNPLSSAVRFTVFAKALFTFKEEGRFTDFNGQVAYNPKDPAATRVDVTVYTSSVDTTNKDHDAMLRSDGFFETSRYPTMRFVSTGAGVRPDGSLLVKGNLTIRDVTKEIEVPVRIQPAGAGGDARLETSFDIDRTEFGINGSPKVGGFSVSIGKKVNVRLIMATSVTRFMH
jgi:polyisoprenoid-binding protein YceI